MCYKPITLETYGRVPCGKCGECRKAHFNGWYQRLKTEAEYSYSASFITLTYDDKHLPDRNGVPTLVKAHFQNFMKRLRLNYPPEYRIKYYAVGEYGGQTQRPHYHAIIFNHEEKDIQKAWTESGEPIGHTYHGQVNDATIQYTLGYLKKPRSNYDDKQKEFSLMSKGLGERYIEEMADWHRKDPINRNFFMLQGGTKIALSRYFKERIFDDAMLADIKESRNNEVFTESVKQNMTLSIEKSFAEAKQNALIRIEKDRKLHEKLNHKL